jgi:sarcosine oxidase gamma subunit
VTRLWFLSPHEADVPGVSPLREVHPTAFTDVSELGKLEVRGDVRDLDAIHFGPGRALVVVDGDVRAERDRLVDEGYRVYDMTGALAALDVEGDELMRRLTELDLEQLPAIGSIARGTTALVERRGSERYRLFVPQELGQFVAEVVEDMAKGLRR